MVLLKFLTACADYEDVQLPTTAIRLTEELLYAPEVRRELVETLQAAIHGGYYAVGPEEIAEALLNDQLRRPPSRMA